MTTINIDAITLKAGAHKERGEDSVGLLEAVAWMAGEPHSDRPECVSPVLAAFGRSWNDGMRSDAEREQLKQYIPLLLNTRSTPEVEERRAWMATDWLARVCAPAWLRLAKLDSHADALERLEPIVSAELAALAQPSLDAAGDAAWDATRAATRAAARTSALASAWAAARDAAWAATRAATRAAARTAALDAALDAARGAARAAAAGAAWEAVGAAARAAAGDALEPTVQQLQASAHELYRRMIEAA